MSDNTMNRKVDHNLGKIFFKLRVSVDVLVTRKKIFSESSYRIETNIEVVVEVL